MGSKIGHPLHFNVLHPGAHGLEDNPAMLMVANSSHIMWCPFEQLRRT
jgi:hypothetical protein